MDIYDRGGEPYTVELDEDDKALCPWAELPERKHVWPKELTDVAVESFVSRENNREQRRRKREMRRISGSDKELRVVNE